ncbi:MAG: hypothetical protein EOM67_15750 [Spirochaetia bacterium]|nr:hypothetical protein [Spirochaetia bacterium]
MKKMDLKMMDRIRRSEGALVLDFTEDVKGSSMYAHLIRRECEKRGIELILLGEDYSKERCRICGQPLSDDKRLIHSTDWEKDRLGAVGFPICSGCFRKSWWALPHYLPLLPWEEKE